MDYKVKINLKKLLNAGVMNIKGATSAKRCVVIPIEDNFIYEGSTGNLYLDLYAKECVKDNDTHFLKLSVPKTAYERMTDEHKKSIPIVGNLSAVGGQQAENTSSQSKQPAQTPSAEATNDEPLPF